MADDLHDITQYNMGIVYNRSARDAKVLAGASPHEIRLRVVSEDTIDCNEKLTLSWSERCLDVCPIEEVPGGD